VKLTTHIHHVRRLRMHGTIPPLPQYAFMARCLGKHMDRRNFLIKSCFRNHQNTEQANLCNISSTD